MIAGLRAWGAAVGALALLTALAVATVDLRTDISFFLPDARTAETQALTQGLSQSGSVIMARLSGLPPQDLAALSDRFVQRMRGVEGVALVRNGRPHLPPDLREFLVANRYLLGPPVAPDHFETGSLEAGIARSLAGLGTTAGWAFRDLIPRDPMGRTRTVLTGLGRVEGPARRHGVWMDAADRALILIRLTAPSGDISAQSTALRAMETALAGETSVRLETSGPGLFALRASERIRAEMKCATLIASAAVALLLLAVFRAPRLLLLAGVPAGAGILTGILATQAIFGSVHGVAITFGAVLSGVAVDYPVHLFGHRRAGEAATATARRLGRPLLIGALTTAAGLAALTQSSFPGLAQIGVLAGVGMAVAYSVSRYLLSALAGAPPAPTVPAPGFWQGLWRRLGRRHGLRAAALGGFACLFALACLAAWRSDAPVWERDLSKLSVADSASRSLDGELRAALRLPDVRRAVLVIGDSDQTVLARQSALLGPLDDAVAAGRLGGYVAAARVLPTLAEQRARQAAMPNNSVLSGRLAAAAAAIDGVSAETFAPFADDIARQRGAEPLTPQAVAAGPLGPVFAAPWPVGAAGEDWAGLIALIPPAAFDATAYPWARTIDLAAVAGGIVQIYRDEALRLLAIGLAIGCVCLAIGIRAPGRIVRVLIPPVGAVALTAALLLAAGVPLTLFHLLAFLLVAGIGVDYSLFYPDYSADPEEGMRGLRSVAACCGTSVAVFATLAASSLPVLSAIGTVVAIGAALSFSLTVCTAGRAPSRAA